MSILGGRKEYISNVSLPCATPMISHFNKLATYKDTQLQRFGESVFLRKPMRRIWSTFPHQSLAYNYTKHNTTEIYQVQLKNMTIILNIVGKN